MEAYVDTLCLLTQPKERQQKFKNKKQPALTENRTVWKFDNQDIKKTHSPRMVGGAEMCSQVERTPGKVASGGAGSPTFTCR